MFQTSPSFMCLLRGKDYVFEQANERYLQLIGHRDIIGKPLSEAMPEVQSQGYIELLDQVRSSGIPYIGKEIAAYLQRSPGAPLERRYLDFVYQATTPDDGELPDILVHGNDVTDMVHARTQIENERENFRNLFKQTPEMVCILSGPEHVFEFVNQAHIHALGFDATGMAVRTAQPESVEVHGILDNVYKTGVTAELREIPVTLGDRVRYFNLTYAARHDSAGNTSGIMILGVEITDQVLTRRELEQSKEEAEQANLVKTYFMANMSHEIRTPLAAILGFSELLKGHFASNSESEDYLNRILRNASLLEKLIDDLLDLSKVEADKLEMDVKSVSLTKLIEDVIDTLSLRAQEKGVDLVLHCSSDAPDFISTDALRYRQILLNIIGNAVKFTESKGRVEIEFSVEGKDSDIQLLCKVRDTGIGLSAPHREKIFEPFVQGDPSVTRKFGGSGLGLALSKRLAKLLRGDISLTYSEPGKGSEFLISIGIGQTQSKGESDSTQAQCNIQKQPHYALMGKRILVVDDSTDNRTLMDLFLKKTGAKIEMATNGLEAVKATQIQNYDVILMDIQMPIMDGYQALSKIQDAGIKTPVIAVTAHAFKEERARCIEAGFTSYLPKPLSREKLIETISNTVV